MNKRKQQRQQKRNDPVWAQQRKEQRQSRWNKAKHYLRTALPWILQLLAFFKIPIPNTHNNLMQLNQTTFNPFTFVVETIVRLFTKSPRYFNVAKWIVAVTAGALATLNYIVDPATAIELSPQATAAIGQTLKYLGVIFATLQLAVQDKK